MILLGRHINFIVLIESMVTKNASKENSTSVGNKPEGISLPGTMVNPCQFGCKIPI